MCGEKDKLDDKKKIRTYAKRLVTVFSVTLGIVYIATRLFHISGFSLHFAIAGTILSVISLTLNTWSLTDYFQKQKANKEIGIENTPEQKNLLRICLDIASSALFLVGSVASIFLLGTPIVSFISTPLFILGYAIMGVNIVRWLIDSEPQTEKNNNIQVEQHSCPGVGQEA